jgi:ketosteroid isomerase-like protein
METDEIRSLYDAFNRRDVDAVLERLAPDVVWANGMEGGHVEGREAVRDYWTRQFREIASRVEPENVTVDGGRTVVTVHQVVHSVAGELLADQRVTHVFTLEDGKIARFDIGEA